MMPVAAARLAAILLSGLLPLSAAALAAVPRLENDGRGCPDAPLPPHAGPGLPDPFLAPDGQRVQSRAQWRCQRQAVLRAAEAHVYGSKGPAPERVDAEFSRDRLRVTVAHDGREVGFEAGLHLPDGPGPHPVLIVIGASGVVDGRLLADEGVARIDVVPTVFGAETGQSRAKQGAFFALYGEPVQASGTLVAWAWGISRIIDAIEASGGALLRADAVAVAGCSRYGKGALAAGAFDARVALTIPIESGAGGVPLWRGLAEAGAQPPQSAFGEQPWLGDGFAVHAGEVAALPLDQHMVLGLVAPRGLLVLDSPHVDWLGARAGHVSALAAAEVYRALGAAGHLGYHSAVEDPRHCAWRQEWDQPMRHAIRRHLLGAPAEDLAIVAADAKAGRLDGHRHWSTPDLP